MRRHRAAAFTLIEVMVALGVLGVVMALFVTGLSESRQLLNANQTTSDMELQGSKAFRAMTSILQRSGHLEYASRDYPTTFQGGTPPGGFAAQLAHPLPADVAPSGWAAVYQGASDAVVFKVPTDLDGDGRPIDDQGFAEWSDLEYAFLVRPGPDGINQLELVVVNRGTTTVRCPEGLAGEVSFPPLAAGAVHRRVIARHVERLQVESVGALARTRLKLTLAFCRRLAADQYIGTFRSTVVWLRNYAPDPVE